MQALAVLAALAVAVMIPMGLHQVPEGHRGVYWRGGALLSSFTSPGFHLKVPLLTSVHFVQMTMQSDQVRDIPCGTRGGVMIFFEKVEVVNRLNEDLLMQTIRNYTVNYDKLWIFDRVHHEINEICSAKTLEQVYITDFQTLDELLMQALAEDIAKYAPGIEIISVRVTKPRIPDTIQGNFEKMEAERTKLLVAVEEQKVIAKEAETQKLKATIGAQKHADVSEIQTKMHKKQKLAAQKMSQIEDEIHTLTAKADADAKLYTEAQLAKANKLKHTPEYLQLAAMLAIKNNSKAFFVKKGTDFVKYWDGTGP